MKEIERVAQLLADINFVLITGGANTRRVLRNVNRIAEALNYRCDIFYSFSAIILTLAYIFGGDHHNSYLEFGMSFLATLLGLAGRRILQLRKFNIFICWAWAAFISVSVVNGFRLLGVEEYKNALAACGLWLIPGVPLINGFIDLLTGYVVAGIAKLTYGMMLIFMISIGFYLSLFIFGYELL